jgi:tetratricopeptide (TPR) repeat protein
VESSYGLALVLYDCGQFKPSIRELNLAKKRYNESGLQDPTLLAELELGLGNGHLALETLEKALSHYETCLVLLSNSKAGSRLDSPEQAPILFNIGLTHQKLHHAKDALSFMKRALCAAETVLGGGESSIIFTAEISFSIGIVLVSLGRHRESIVYYEKALKLRRAVTRSGMKADYKDPSMVRILQGIAHAHLMCDHFREAIDVLHKCKVFRQEAFGRETMEAGDIYSELGYCYFKTRHFNTARIYLDRVYRIRRDHLGEKHEKTIQSLNRLVKVQNVAEEFASRRPMAGGSGRRKRDKGGGLLRAALMNASSSPPSKLVIGLPVEDSQRAGGDGDGDRDRDGDERVVLHSSVPDSASTGSHGDVGAMIAPHPFALTYKKNRSDSLRSIMTEATWDVPVGVDLSMEQDLSGFDDPGL